MWGFGHCGVWEEAPRLFCIFIYIFLSFKHCVDSRWCVRQGHVTWQQWDGLLAHCWMGCGIEVLGFALLDQLNHTGGCFLGIMPHQGCSHCYKPWHSQASMNLAQGTLGSSIVVVRWLVQKALGQCTFLLL